MKLVPNRYLIGVLALYLGSAATTFAADKTTAAPSWKTDLVAWRAQQAKNLQTPNGWLTVIGLEWLKAGDNSFGSAKSNAAVIKAPTAPSLGVIKLNGESLQLLPPSGGYPAGLLGQRCRPGESAGSRGRFLRPSLKDHRRQRHHHDHSSRRPLRAAHQGLEGCSPHPISRIEVVSRRTKPTACRPSGSPTIRRIRSQSPQFSEPK